MTFAPLSRRLLTRCPPMKPPAPQTTTLAFFSFMKTGPQSRPSPRTRPSKSVLWQRLVSHTPCRKNLNWNIIGNHNGSIFIQELRAIPYPDCEGRPQAWLFVAELV